MKWRRTEAADGGRRRQQEQCLFGGTRQLLDDVIRIAEKISGLVI